MDFKAFFQAIPGRYLVVLPDAPIYTVVAVSDGYVSGAATPREALLGKGLFQIFPDNPNAERPTGAEVVASSFHRVRSNRVPDQLQRIRYGVEIPASEGGGFEERYFDILNVPVLGPDGQVAYILHSFEELTERVRAELKSQAARESMQARLEVVQARLEQVFKQAPIALAVVRGKELVFELANPFYQELAGRRELVGRRLADAIPELSPDVFNTFQGVLDTGEPYSANDWLIPYDKDGDGLVEDHWFSAFFHPLRELDLSISGLVVINIEVSSHVLAHRQLVRANLQMEEFAYAASHDLQEPLRMVAIYTQLLLQRHVDTSNDQAKEFAGRVREGVRRLELLIQDLLLYSRATHDNSEGPSARTDLNVAFARAVSALQAAIETSGAQIECGNLPCVIGDESHLCLVFQNLMGNSIKYAAEAIAPKIQVSAKKTASEWVIYVQDNGIGFSPAYAERIFGLFKRLGDKSVPGTGLGLAICRRLIERYGGRIWAESSPGQGARFSFALPSERSV